MEPDRVWGGTWQGSVARNADELGVARQVFEH